jgi:hypothetical protein
MHAVPDRLAARTLLVACLFLGGCANFSEQQCRATSWYSLGEQDALIYGLQPQIDAIAYQCQKFGVQVPAKEYMDGWTYGNRERYLRLGGESP